MNWSKFRNESTPALARGLVALIAILWVYGCNDGPQVQTPDMGVTVVQPDTSHTKSLVAFEARVADRFAKNDTAIVDHQKLLHLITDSIPGYKLEVNESKTFHAPLFTFAEASKVFYNSEEDYIEFTAGDYVTNPDFFRVNIQRYNLAVGVEISGVKDEKRLDPELQPAEAKDFFVWASYNNRKHIAWVYIGIDERYFVTIEATAQDSFLDMERVKQWLDWGKLWEKS